MSDTTEAKADIAANMSKFVEGVLIKGKLFGVETVHKETGDDVCQDAMIKLKAIIAVKKEHKQRLNIKVDLEGIEIMDDNMQLMYKHSVNRIAYIARDLKDPRAIGYIYKNEDASCQYFGLRTEKQAQEFFNLLKDLFEVVLEMRNNKKKGAAKEPTEPEKNPADKPVEAEQEPDTSDKARLISITEPEPEPASAPAPVVAPASPVAAPEAPASPATEPAAVKTPEAEPSLFDLSDPTTPAMDKNSTPAMDDLFGLGDLTLDGSASPQVSASGMNNDLFTMMNAPVSPQPSAAAPFQNPATNFSPFGMPQQGMSSQYGQPAQQPFGMPMGMPQYNQQLPRAAPVPPMSSPTPAAPAAPTNKVPTNAFDDLFN